MAKIELTAKEIEVIEQQLQGKIEVYTATDEQQEILGGVIDKATELAQQTQEDFDDLIQWYYDKYKAQN